MKTLRFLAVLWTAAACAAPRTISTPASVPAPVPSPAPTTAPVKAAMPPAEAQRNWQLLDETIDGVPGIGGKDGKDVHYDTFEVTRLYGWCTNTGPSPGPVAPDEKSKCDDIKREFEK